MKFLNVLGARPNIMKIAPLQREMKQRSYEFSTVHTGQHYDDNMSSDFFSALEMDIPDYNLETKSGSHAEQTAKIMERFEPILDRYQPDIVVVVGDVNSTLAAGLVTAKKSPHLAHVESGIRSGDVSMPEEVNRKITDQISDYLFCFDKESCKNLRSEGIEEDRIYLVGDIMIDSLHFVIDREPPEMLKDLPERYGVLTLHRPSNVDTKSSLEKAFNVLTNMNDEIPLVFPAHPRTEKNLKQFGLYPCWKEEFLWYPPLDYYRFAHLLKNATLVATDSGSIQQETTVLNIPCLTFRKSTERPITIRRGTNELFQWKEEEKIKKAIQAILSGNWKHAENIELWDGHTAKRILDVLAETHVGNH